MLVLKINKQEASHIVNLVTLFHLGFFITGVFCYLQSWFSLLAPTIVKLEP